MSDPPADDTVVVGKGRPSTSFLAVISKVVDGGPSPAMTGEAKPKGQQYRSLV
jgi:hypothetical protein